MGSRNSNESLNDWPHPPVMADSTYTEFQFGNGYLGQGTKKQFFQKFHDFVTKEIRVRDYLPDVAKINVKDWLINDHFIIPNPDSLL